RDPPPHPSACLWYPPAGERRRSARHSGAAGTRAAVHHPALHPALHAARYARLQQDAPPRQINNWVITVVTIGGNAFVCKLCPSVPRSPARAAFALAGVEER